MPDRVWSASATARGVLAALVHFQRGDWVLGLAKPNPQSPIPNTSLGIALTQDRRLRSRILRLPAQRLAPEPSQYGDTDDADQQ